MAACEAAEGEGVCMCVRVADSAQARAIGAIRWRFIFSVFGDVIFESIDGVDRRVAH
jgi:hypothetical protein